eukprot:m.229714 g.229714  ORF g.229714 m.229714 type:complete len:446 (+) comp54258_c0_seq17:152-1489(+)
MLPPPRSRRQWQPSLQRFSASTTRLSRAKSSVWSCKARSCKSWMAFIFSRKCASLMSAATTFTTSRTSMPAQYLHSSVLFIFMVCLRSRSSMKDLQELKLHSNNIESLPNLAKLRNLTLLTLQFNRIKNLGTSLLNLRKLTTLRLHHNALSDLSGLPPSITSLDVSYNSITSLQGIENLHELQELSVACNKLTTLSPLDRCTKLQTLDISGQVLGNLGVLRKMGLEALTANRCNITITAIPQLKKLMHLSLQHNNITTLDGLVSAVPSLETLDIQHNALSAIPDITALRGLPMLAEIFVKGNPVADLPNWDDVAKGAIPSLEVIDDRDVSQLLPLQASASPSASSRPTTARPGTASRPATAGRVMRPGSARPTTASGRPLMTAVPPVSGPHSLAALALDAEYSAGRADLQARTAHLHAAFDSLSAALLALNPLPHPTTTTQPPSQ